MKDIANNNDHAMYYIISDVTTVYSPAVTFDKTVPCNMDNYFLQITNPPNLVLYSYDGSALKPIWNLKSESNL